MVKPAPIALKIGGLNFVWFSYKQQKIGRPSVDARLELPNEQYIYNRILTKIVSLRWVSCRQPFSPCYVLYQHRMYGSMKKVAKV